MITPQMANKIEVAEIASLAPYEKNARTHSPEQVEQIAASISEFGFTNPILVDSKKGIIAGHGRLEAAKALGMTTVPIIELTHLSANQKRAYIIADNKLAENAGWDKEMLREELGELKNADFDLSLTGFMDDELSELAFIADGPTDDDSREGATSKPADIVEHDGREIEKIILAYTRDEFEPIAEKAQKIMGENDLPDFSSLFKYLLVNYGNPDA